MALPYIFDNSVSENIISRINKLNPESKPLWGKMNVAQMLAHCCVTYEFIYEEGKHKKPGGIMKFILKLLIKPVVVSEKPYKHNSKTAPAFLMTDKRVFESEKNRLIGFIQKTQSLGAEYFNGKESHSFGVLSSTEWNNMFYKHINHHLSQFGV